MMRAQDPTPTVLVVLIGLSAGLLLVSAYLSIRLIALTRVRLTWMLLAAAFCLMAVRRMVTVLELQTNTPGPEDALIAGLVLVISVLLVIGLSGVGYLFRRLLRSEQELRCRSDELALSNRKLAEFAAVVAHDLVSPLGSIIGFANLLDRGLGPRVEPIERDYLERIAAAGTRMNRLIHDLLESARYDAGTPPFGEVDLQCVVRDVLTDLQGAIETEGARIEVGPLPLLWGDSLQVRRLVQNLVANALKYRRTGISPSIGITCPEKDRDFATIAIRDNGKGIPAGFLERVFEPNYRVADEPQTPGTGLGLSICREVADYHKGRIWVESVVGQGSTFYVRLPCRASR